MNTIVVDFDGTLIRSNSFPKWIKFVIKSSASSLRLKVLWDILFLLFQRKALKRLSHLEFKKRVDSLNYPSDWGRLFVKQLYQFKSPKVLESVKTEQQKTALPLVISTAAPECYAQYIPEVFFAGETVHCLYSRKLAGNEYFNNFKVNKTLSLKEIVEKGTGFILFSDHSDDYELAKISDFFYLCNPSEKHLHFFENSSTSFALLKDDP